MCELAPIYVKFASIQDFIDEVVRRGISLVRMNAWFKAIEDNLPEVRYFVRCTALGDGAEILYVDQMVARVINPVEGTEERLKEAWKQTTYFLEECKKELESRNIEVRPGYYDFARGRIEDFPIMTRAK